jgi:hypothetical protein
MEMYVSAGFMFEDRDVHATVLRALELFHTNGSEDLAELPEKVKEFESRMSALLGDTVVFEDREYYEYLQGLDELRVNKSGSVSLRLTTGGLGDEFAHDLVTLLKRLGARHVRVRVKTDEGEEWKVRPSRSSSGLGSRLATPGGAVRHLEEATRALGDWVRRQTGPINSEPDGLADLGRLGRHVVECVRRDDTTELPEFFAKLEAVYAEASPELQEWLTVGLLMSIDHHRLKPGLERSAFEGWLGSLARAEWDGINW